jgi:biopolymer transport protein ExbB
MMWLTESWLAHEEFLSVGGNVLRVILIVTLVMWTLIIERYWYLRTGYRRAVERVTEEWRRRDDTTSWHARQIRRQMISELSRQLNQSIPLIRTLVAVCPLLGLLGTVTGMIEMFDVMAIASSSNPRAIASGVSRATITTMAGLVAALSGFVFSVQLERRTRTDGERVADQLSPGR